MTLRCPIKPVGFRGLHVYAAYAATLGIDFAWTPVAPGQVELQGDPKQLAVCVRELAENGLLVRGTLARMGLVGPWLAERGEA